MGCKIELYDRFATILIQILIQKYYISIQLALDPALPQFEQSSNISPKSAKFVNVIHTDAGYFGNPKDLGHADFYVNGGEALQPGCSWQEIAERWLGIIGITTINFSY